MDKDFPLSRTARGSDQNVLEIDQLLLEYAAAPKEFSEFSRPKYKFWNYAIAFKVMQEQDYQNILDIGAQSYNDYSYCLLAKHREYEIDYWPYLDFMGLSILDNRYDLVTCFGLIEMTPRHKKLFSKLAKHVRIGGTLIVTTEEEVSFSQKYRPHAPSDLLDLSLTVEDKDYILYGLDEYVTTDYKDDKNGLHSLVLQRVGAKHV